MASIQKRPDGKWRARYRDENGTEHSRHFAFRSAAPPDKIREGTRRPGDSAQEWLDDVTSSIVSGMYVDPTTSRTPLRTFYDDWADRQVWADNTRAAMDLAVRSCTFASEPLVRISRSHVETWVKGMVSSGLQPSTIRTRVSNVRSVIRAAVVNRYIPRDPAEGVVLPRQRRVEARMVIPTPEQVQTFLDAAEPRFRTFLALCAFAGLRLGEAAGVQVGDIDFLRRQVTVRRQVQAKPGGGSVIVPPKYGSERIVYLPDDLVQILARHVEGGVRPEGWLFWAGSGEPPHRNIVGPWWRRLTRALPDEITFTVHDLRHFYASGLIAAGCDVVTVQRALGHSKATTTLNTYSHLWPTAEDRTRAAAADLMRSSRGLSADSTLLYEAASPGNKGK